jgi:hypothetical protein
MTTTTTDRAGETVTYMRCGTLQTATITGWDYVSGPRGLTRGDQLEDPRYAAKSPRGMAVAVCESEIRRPAVKAVCPNVNRWPNWHRSCISGF